MIRYAVIAVLGLTIAVSAMPYDVLPAPDPCQTCNFIIGRAEHHFLPNETSDQLKTQLDRECQQLANWQGQQAADQCQAIVDANIQTIYNDISAGKRPYQICKDIGECGTATGGPASFIDILPSAHDPCRTCEFLIGRAEYYVHSRNITDEQSLLRELEHECIQLAHIQGDQAAIQCLDVARQNIDTIYADVQAHKTPRQICTDIGECTAMMTTPTSKKSK